MTRRAVTLTLLGVQVVTATAGLLLDVREAGVAVLVLGVAVLAVELSTPRRADPPPGPVEPGMAAGLRKQRERDGEIAAIRSLRRARPDIPLGEAVKLIRGL